MKKFILALAFLGLGTMANAQDVVVPAHKYSVATNSFWANWYVSAGGEFNAAYSSQEGNVSKNPFSSARGTFGFNVAVGKWFTPSIGLRTKFQGLWSKQVNTKHNHPSYKYYNLHEDVTFNLSNMIYGYDEARLWNFIPYVGIGLGRDMSHSTYDITYNFGLLNNFRINKRVQAFVDLYLTAMEGSFDGGADGWQNYQKTKLHHWDKMAGIAVGVTYNLGTCTWEKAPDVNALVAMNREQMDALNASLKEQQDENARLRDLLAQQKKVQPVSQTNSVSTKELVTTSSSVFFNIGSSRIASRKDLVNVKELAEYAKANGGKIVVSGYADSKTGSAAYNQQLSQKRAEAVANELVKMGVNRDNIVVEAKGGVNTISPYSYNRRATVKLQ